MSGRPSPFTSSTWVPYEMVEVVAAPVPANATGAAHVVVADHPAPVLRYTVEVALTERMTSARPSPFTSAIRTPLSTSSWMKFTGMFQVLLAVKPAPVLRYVTGVPTEPAVSYA